MGEALVRREGPGPVLKVCEFHFHPAVLDSGVRKRALALKSGHLALSG